MMITKLFHRLKVLSREEYLHGTSQKWLTYNSYQLISKLRNLKIKIIRFLFQIVPPTWLDVPRQGVEKKKKELQASQQPHPPYPPPSPLAKTRVSSRSCPPIAAIVRNHVISKKSGNSGQKTAKEKQRVLFFFFSHELLFKETFCIVSRDAEW